MSSPLTYDSRQVEKARRSRPPLTPRELGVLVLAAIVIVLTPLAWGGTVLWAVLAAVGFSLAALLLAVGTLSVQRLALVIGFAGIVVGLLAAAQENAAVLSLRWLEFMAFPCTLFLGAGASVYFLSGDTRSRPADHCRHDLFTLVPFWAGLALFGYFAVQDFNAWGIVIDREFFWAKQGIPGVDPGTFDIRPLPYINWLPSGLKAPFSSAETSQPPMNAWRVILILAGPWLLFCALRCGLRRRRGYVILVWISVVTACAFALGGFLNQYSSGTIMGIKVPETVTCFGPFINRNHAGVYLYLNLALALALTFWHIRRASSNAFRGGPHLVSGFLALYLALFVLLTNSMGASAVVVALFLFSLPLGYFFGLMDHRDTSREVAFVTFLALILASLALLFMTDLSAIAKKVTVKSEAFQKTGADDRAPYRRATWELATEGGATGRVWMGWGAGSFGWVSPPYQAKQRELQGPDGKLKMRAIYAHNDWLQMLAEWGVVGLLAVGFFLYWLAGWVRRALRAGLAETIPLVCVLLFFSAHGWVELIIWFMPLMISAVLVTASLLAFVEQSSGERKERSRYERIDG